MSRAARLLDLLQALRRYRQPVTAAVLAESLGVAVRTIYRDIVTLQAQGATIEGEAGVGYVLRPGFTLPPLMFSPDEIEAVMLGLRLVAERADPALRDAADDAAAKIAAVLPDDLRASVETELLIAGPSAGAPDGEDAAILRQAIRDSRKLGLDYRDKGQERTNRIVWPIAIGYFANARVLIAWCELRQDFRHFRLDRIVAAAQGARYPQRRAALLRAWRAQQGS